MTNSLHPQTGKERKGWKNTKCWRGREEARAALRGDADWSAATWEGKGACCCPRETPGKPFTRPLAVPY